MYIIIEAWWPAGKSEEVGKIYLNAMKKFPNDKTISKVIVPAAVWSVKDGMHSIVIDSAKPGKIQEAMTLAVNRPLIISQSVEGYQFQMNIAYDLVEAMPLVGLKAPE